MKKIALKLDDLTIESFPTTTQHRGGVLSRATDMRCTDLAGCGTTHSLDYATHCDCSGGFNCTLACVEYSQATDIQACCG